MSNLKRKRASKLLKQFSTLTEGTLHSPSLLLCLELVSKLFYRHIILNDGCIKSEKNIVIENKFNIDNFLSSKYRSYILYSGMIYGMPTILTQKKQGYKCGKPRYISINNFLTGIFKKLRLNVESSIVSLIYAERLMLKQKICINQRNWRPIIIASVLTASKVWDDLSSWNIEFSNLLPRITLRNINILEGLFLNALEYDLYISSSEYARYYFALRALKNTKITQIPRYYLDTKIVNSKGIELKRDDSIQNKHDMIKTFADMNNNNNNNNSNSNNSSNNIMLNNNNSDDDIKHREIFYSIDKNDDRESLLSMYDGSIEQSNGIMGYINDIKEEYKYNDNNNNNNNILFNKDRSQNGGKLNMNLQRSIPRRIQVNKQQNNKKRNNALNAASMPTNINDIRGNE